ncbi:hypothetical protein HYDPIDRAFT_36026 [Hydnomerulius pinastri MD-312]|nr:hypothetical protein HYDPIDRAFT_36026 [Hydnomerulius pinastri MD-312]
MSIANIWDDDPVGSPPNAPPASSSSKRPRPSLFLSDSDSDTERPAKRRTPAPPSPRPDIDALFADLDNDDDGAGADEDLRYKPLAPALDLAKLAREAEAKHARAKRAGRLVGPSGFPQLIKDTKGFKPKGKGHEHTDLNRILQVYQFWTHRMYPKTSFEDTVDRVEKLCHSRRMQVRLSVWRDESKGLIHGKKPNEDDPDVIDLTEPTLVGTEHNDDSDENAKEAQSKNDRASSRAPSLPPSSSAADDDDDFDIDAVIRAEEARLASLRATNPRSTSMSTPPPARKKATYRENPDADTNAMDVDEAALWDDLDTFADPQPQVLLDPPPQSATPSSASAPPDDDEDMWDIVNEIEQGQPRPQVQGEVKSKVVRNQVPISSVILTPSETESSGNTSRATNDEDWDDMYI